VELPKKPLDRCGSVVGSGKTCCNGSSLVPTLTRNRTADLELLLTLDITQHVESVWEVPLGAVVQGLLVPGEAVGVFLEHHCVVDGVEDTC